MTLSRLATSSSRIALRVPLTMVHEFSASRPMISKQLMKLPLFPTAPKGSMTKIISRGGLLLSAGAVGKDAHDYYQKSAKSLEEFPQEDRDRELRGLGLGVLGLAFGGGSLRAASAGWSIFSTELAQLGGLTSVGSMVNEQSVDNAAGMTASLIGLTSGKLSIMGDLLGASYNANKLANDPLQLKTFVACMEKNIKEIDCIVPEIPIDDDLLLQICP